MSVATAHEICDRIEYALGTKVGEALISIHVEPDSKSKNSGIIVL
jgi:divalent metal cation (Fe/Co/Zn/Cd) transporter